MGADVYFRVKGRVELPEDLKDFERCVEVHKDHTIFYFRDSYNASNLAERTGNYYYDLAKASDFGPYVKTEIGLEFFKRVANTPDDKIPYPTYDRELTEYLKKKKRYLKFIVSLPVEEIVAWV